MCYPALDPDIYWMENYFYEIIDMTVEMVALNQSQRLEYIYASSEGTHTHTHTHTQSKINKVLRFIAR